jgi:AraC-like DNA-binding protein
MPYPGGVFGKPLLPLGKHPFFHSADLDETVETFSKVNTPVRVERTDRIPYFWHANHLAVGPLALFAYEWGGGCAARTEIVRDIFILNLPLDAVGGEGRHDGVTVPYIEGETGILLSPDRPAAARLASGFRSLEVVVRREDVEVSLTALAGPKRRKPLAFEPRVSLASGAGRSLNELVRFFADQADRDDRLLASPLIAARLADAVLFGMLMGLPHNHSVLLSSSPAAEPRHVRRAAEFLEANASQAVRIADLAALTGVSIRTLQAGFLKYRGLSPMAFLRSQRLALARTKLCGNPFCSITQIALDCGFEHAGRFSALYRARFGETPSATRRRAR